MAGMKWAPAALIAAGAALVLAACDNGPSAVARNDREAPRPFAEASAPSGPQVSERRDGGDDAAPREDHRGEPAMEVDGKAMWAATRRYSAQEGARRSFERNGEDFGAASLDAYVRKAHDFVAHPPAGVERMARPNGDTVFYDAKANVFAVADKDGLPKTMFKPDEGAKYWQDQKDRDARRETARRSQGRDEG